MNAQQIEGERFMASYKIGLENDPRGLGHFIHGVIKDTPAEKLPYPENLYEAAKFWLTVYTRGRLDSMKAASIETLGEKELEAWNCIETLILILKQLQLELVG